MYWLYGCEDVVELAAFRTYCKTFMFAAMCVCLGRSLIRIRSGLGGVCALVMYVFQTRRSELPFCALGRVMFELGMGSVWTKSEVVYIAETVRSQRAVFAFVCARAC